MKKLIIALTAVFMILSQNAVMAERFGICTHMGLRNNYNNDSNIEAAKKLNAGWIRDEARWLSMQSSYDAPLKIRDKDLDYIKKADEQGLNQLLILAYGNSDLKENGPVPTQDDMQYYNAFLDYVRYTISTVADYVDAYELWNEPNIPTFNYNMLADGEDYAKLYLDVKKIVDELDPTAPLLCGSITGAADADFEYGKKIFDYIKSQGDVNELIDAFSLHAYSNNVDTGFLSTIGNWDKVFDSYGFTGDVWLTECGISSNTGNNTEQQQAEYVAKLGMQWENFLKTNNRDGVVFWYDLRSDGTDPEDYEHNLGVFDYYYAEKPAFYSMLSYNNLTEDKEFESLQKIKTKNYIWGDDEYGYVATYSDGTDNLYIVYNKNNNNASYLVPLSGDVAFVYDYLGNITETINNPSGTKSIVMETSPKFIECRTCEVTLDADFDAEDGVLKLSGTYNVGDSVTVELLRDGAEYKTLNLTLNDGNYDCWMSVLDNGNYTVRVARPELLTLGKENGWAEETFFVERYISNPELKNVNVSYVAEQKKVSVSGSVADCYDEQYVTLLVIPESMDAENLDKNAMGYIRQVLVLNGEFKQDFILPEYFETKAKVYIGGTGIDGANAEILNIGEGKFLYVKEIDLTVADKISASAVVRNFTENKKKATIVIAQYDEDGRLLKMETAEKTVSAKTYEAFDISFNDVLKESGAKSAKAFIVSDLTGFVPLAEADEKSIN